MDTTIRSSMVAVITLAMSAAAAACSADDTMTDETEEELAEAEHEITGGTAADLWSRARVASLGNCTAIIVGTRHLLTASHCMPQVGSSAKFYTTTNASYVPVDDLTSREIQSVAYPPGVNPSTGDYTDSNGKFADIAVIRLTAPIPATSTVATLAWAYPAGGDDFGVKIGQGGHEGGPNADNDLRGVVDSTYSDNDAEGHFLTENEQSDLGDSGGPFFYSGRALGVLFGSVFEWEYRNKYSSVQQHLPWILTTMSYAFSGTLASGSIVNGTTLSTPYASSSRECSYICDKTSSCVAFNFTPVTPWTPCTLKSTNTGSAAMGGATSGVK
ncbi:MAG: trypsin-like serine protease [Polyangiaceae bacterium]|jgi:hypothetical protein|nr:trypsin-like serine protease [Polyangiaceae bacterium]